MSRHRGGSRLPAKIWRSPAVTVLARAWTSRERIEVSGVIALKIASTLRVNATKPPLKGSRLCDKDSIVPA